MILLIFYRGKIMYKLAIFDMDGTLADTSPGIILSHQYTHRMMGKIEPTEKEIIAAIGSPLKKTYRERFGFTEEETEKAIEIYLEHYRKSGIKYAKLYTGTDRVLETLAKKGIKLAVASLKAEKFLQPMLENMSIIHLFSAICGMDENHSATKAGLILKCMELTGTPPAASVMIGDSEVDREGAKAVGVDFIGLAYGIGFSRDHMKDDDMCEKPEDILDKLR